MFAIDSAVPVDHDAFCRAYFGDTPLPLGVAPGWTIAGAAADRVRRAVDLYAHGPDGMRLTIFAERASEGTPFLVATTHLHLSYYSDAGADDASAADVVRATARVLADREETISTATIARIFPVGDSLDASANNAIEVRINRECNEACLFCNTPETSEAILPRDAIRRTIESERAAGFEQITITGREPTLDPNLIEYVSLAREVGYRVVRVQTNGTAFASRQVLQRLVDAGMNAAEVSLHTIDPAVFRTVLRVAPKLLDKTLEGLRNLADQPTVTTTLVVVLTRFNLDRAADLVAYVGDTLPHVSLMTISPMAPVGDGATNTQALPRMADLTPAFADIFAAADRHGVQVIVPTRCGAPLCVMPRPYLERNHEHANPDGIGLEPAKSKPATCRACVYDARCAGVWTGYLDTYGAADLVPIRSR